MPPPVCPVRVLTTIRKAEYAELVALFGQKRCRRCVARGVDRRPRSARPRRAPTLRLCRDRGSAAFISPLIFGAMADRHASPVKVLRGLAFGTAVMATVVSSAINAGWNAWLVLGLIQIAFPRAAPLLSIASAIIFARLADSSRSLGRFANAYARLDHRLLDY